MEKFILLFKGNEVYQPGQAPESYEALSTKMMNATVEIRAIQSVQTSYIQ